MVDLPPWSYSFLNDYQICPHRCFHKFVARDVPYEETAATRWGNEVHNAFDKRISAGVLMDGDCAKYEPLAAIFDGRKAATELRLGVRKQATICGFYDEDVWGRVKIDCLVEPGDGTARLFDWKTGKKREDNFELRIQGLFTYLRNPELRAIHGWYVWLAEGPAGQLGAQHDLSDVQKTWAEVESIMNTIGNNAAVQHWAKREGPMCKFCPVKTCEFNKTP